MSEPQPTAPVMQALWAWTFTPQKNIKAYELALFFKSFRLGETGLSGVLYTKAYEDFPREIARHFTRCPEKDMEGMVAPRPTN